MTKSRDIPHSPYLPIDPKVANYNAAFGHLVPWEFNGWKAETLSWKNSCYLHAGLNPAYQYRLSGTDALRLLTENSINDFTKFSVGASKYIVMCNERGNVMTDGMVWRLGEDDFVSFFLSPYLDYLVASGRYDVQGQDLSKKRFLFQVAGPLSLNVLERATGESLRDIEFIWHRASQIMMPSGMARPVRIYRLGVARTLAYEVHGDIADALDVYAAIMASGEAFGIERLGLQAYGMNHTEGGFAQSFIHFLPAWTEDKEFMAFLDENTRSVLSRLPGSAGPDVAKRYANPIELGLSHMTAFDREFTGSEALKEIASNPRRKIVTLEWSADDILEIYASQFRNGGDAQFMDFAANPVWQGTAMSVVFADDVFADDKLVGISSGRMFSQYYKTMISLGIIETEQALIGNEVEVLWGDPGTPQKRIRAKVARYPYLDLPFNRDIDVRSSITDDTVLHAE